MDDRPHILVVDDDSRLCGLLDRYLGENGFRVTTANDAAEARARMRGIEFDLLVLDVMMPGEDGLSLTQSLRASSQLPILLLTAMAEPEERIRGLERGADDYLTKPFEPRELVLRILSILRRVGPTEDSVRFGDCVYDAARRRLTRDDAVVQLTTIETTLLSVLARSPGATLSREELVRRCGIDGTDRTVDVQVTRLRRKIEPNPRAPRYLQTVRGEGYVLHPD